MRYVIKGSPRAESAISRFLSRLENFTEVGPEVHRVMRRQARKTFDTKGRNIGESWPGYTAGERVYGLIKKKLIGKKHGEKLLRWKPGNERLYPSVVAANHPEHVWRVDGRSFTFGTKVPHAYKHQEGKGRGPWWAGFGRVKRRKFIGISKESAAEIRRIMSRHVGI